MVGQFALGLAITTPVILLFNLQLRAIQATDATNEYRFGDYLNLRLLTTGLALLVVLGMVWWGNYQNSSGWVIVLLVIAKAIESISDLLYGLLQQRERMDRIATSMMIKGVLSLLMLGITIFLTRNILWGVSSLILVWAIVLLGYDLPNGYALLTVKSDSQQQPSQPLYPQPLSGWQWQTMLRLVKGSLPLGVVAMLISLNSNIPRYFIEHYLGQRELGYFSAIAYLQIGGTTVVSALGQSTSPRLAYYYASQEQEKFYRLLMKLVGLSLGLGVAGIGVAVIAGQTLLGLIYQPEYASYSSLLVWIMVSAGFWYLASIAGYAAIAMRRIHYQPIALGIVSLTSLLTCFWFIPNFGLLGAAISVVLASMVAVLTYAYILLSKL